MGDDIETGKKYGFQLLSCTMLIEQKSKQMAIRDRPKPVSLPINNSGYPLVKFFRTIS